MGLCVQLIDTKICWLCFYIHMPRHDYTCLNPCETISKIKKNDKSVNHYYFKKMSNNKCWKQKRDQLLKQLKQLLLNLYTFQEALQINFL